MRRRKFDLFGGGDILPPLGADETAAVPPPPLPLPVVNNHISQPALKQNEESELPNESKQHIHNKLQLDFEVSRKEVNKILPTKGVWSCEACTFDNDQLNRRCDICQTKKRGASTSQSSSSVSSDSSETEEGEEDDDSESITEECLSPKQQIKRQKPIPVEETNVLDLDVSPVQPLQKSNSPVFEAPPPTLPVSGNTLSNNGVPIKQQRGNVDLGYVELLINTPSVSNSPVDSDYQNTLRRNRLSNLSVGSANPLNETPPAPPTVQTNGLLLSDDIPLSRQQYHKNITPAAHVSGISTHLDVQVQPNTTSDDGGFKTAFTLSKVNNNVPLEPLKKTAPWGNENHRAPLHTEVLQPHIAFQQQQSATSLSGFQPRQRETITSSNAALPGLLQQQQSNTVTNTGGFQQQTLPSCNNSFQNGFRIETPSIAVQQSKSYYSAAGIQQQQRQVDIVRNGDSESTFQSGFRIEAPSIPVQQVKSYSAADSIQQQQRQVDIGSNGDGESTFQSGFQIQHPSKLEMRAAGLSGGVGGGSKRGAARESAPSALAMMGNDTPIQKAPAKKSARKPAAKRSKGGKQYIPGEGVYWMTQNGVRILCGRKSGIRLRGPKAYEVWKQSQEDTADGVTPAAAPPKAKKVPKPTKKPAKKNKKSVPTPLGGGLTDFVKKKRKSN